MGSFYVKKMLLLIFRMECLKRYVKKVLEKKLQPDCPLTHIQTLSAKFTITVTGNQFPSQIRYISILYVRFFGGKKNVMFIFWNFSCKWTIVFEDQI